MAITSLTTSLGSFNPVYNPLVYAFSSTNSNKEGFRYVIDIYPAGATTSQANRIFEARVAPRPNDLAGYIDLSKIIASQISFDLNLSSTSSYIAPNSNYAYDVYIGEEFITDWGYQDVNNASGRLMLGPTGGTGASGTQPAHTFQVNDQINISQNDPSIFPALEGLHTVYSVPNSYNIVVDVPFISATGSTGPFTANIGGTASYADNRSTVTRNLLSYTNQVAWNGALQWSDWPAYDDDNYRVNGATAASNINLLTNLPDNFWVVPSQDLHILFATGTTGATTHRAYFKNDSGELFYKSLTGSSYTKIFTAGPNNLGTLTGVTSSGPLISANTLYYDFWIADSVGATLSRSYTVSLDRRCAIDDVELLFLDRLGSFVSYAFNLRKTHTGSVTRETYNRQVGNIVSNKWNYSVSDAGTVNSEIDVFETFEIRTNWMTHEMNVYFEELVTSPVTYIKLNGTYYSCIILDNAFEIQSSTYKRPIRRTLQVQLSSPNIVNI